MDNTDATYQGIDLEYYLPVFKRLPLTVTHAKGARVWDDRGNEYIDAMAGVAVNSVGHCHPHVVKAIKEQAERLIHISNFFISPSQVELAKKLAQKSGLHKVFFANSGAEANEGAIKLARKYAHSKGRGGEIISFTGSFHGRTMATIATGKQSMQKGFEPIPEGFTQIPFNDIAAAREAISDNTAAFIIEPVQGEGGIHQIDEAFLKELKSLCDANDILLIFDEIQCGIARTGYFFAKDNFGIEPDLLTSAKALGGGVPISALLSNEKVANAIDYGDHGTTFGGNPLATRAALAAIEVIESENLETEAAEKGQWLKSKLEELDKSHYDIKEIRGAGLMIGIEFNFETKPLVKYMLHHGILANATAGNVLRLIPPLTISYGELNTVIGVMKQAITELKKQ